jgi:glycosyltransferase involved in cell wall biosynthesis
MRIAQMLDTLAWGGAQKMQMFLIESLQPLGIDITVISLTESSNSPLELKLHEAGIRVVFCPFPQLFSPGSFGDVVNLLKKEKFDLLHAYLTYSNIVGSCAGVLTGTPTIASLRSADFEGRTYTFQRAFLENFSLRFLATRVMANGLAVAKYASHRVKNSRSVDIIPNAVNFVPSISDAEREKLRQELTGDTTRPLILTVGRLTEAKGFPDLIHAFAEVHVQFPSAILVVAGGGSLSDSLNDQIRELGLQEQVILLGSRTDVPRLLAAADIYINSSHWEGTPVSVLEAMSAGLPVIATRVGENPYLLEPDAGVLVHPHQPLELAAALVYLLSSEDRCHKLGAAALERVRNYYNPEIWRYNLLKLYSELTPNALPYLDSFSNKPIQVGKV